MQRADQMQSNTEHINVVGLIGVVVAALAAGLAVTQNIPAAIALIIAGCVCSIVGLFTGPRLLALVGCVISAVNLVFTWLFIDYWASRIFGGIAFVGDLLAILGF